MQKDLYVFERTKRRKKERDSKLAMFYPKDASGTKASIRYPWFARSAVSKSRIHVSIHVTTTRRLIHVFCKVPQLTRIIKMSRAPRSNHKPLAYQPKQNEFKVRSVSVYNYAFLSSKARGALGTKLANPLGILRAEGIPRPRCCDGSEAPSLSFRRCGRPADKTSRPQRW